jgi:hypothetical protein
MGSNDKEALDFEQELRPTMESLAEVREELCYVMKQRTLTPFRAALTTVGVKALFILEERYKGHEIKRNLERYNAVVAELKRRGDSDEDGELTKPL